MRGHARIALRLRESGKSGCPDNSATRFPKRFEAAVML
jgi:hypothetical protein